jgi:HK97 gp10 family phage protein
MKFEGKLQGFEQLSRVLEDLPVNVEKRVLQNATTSAIREAAKEIRKSAPSSEQNQQSEASKEYGKLKRNIKVMRLRRNEKGARSARVHTGRAFWGYFLEMGTRYIPARPWFAPAFERSQENILKKLAERLKEGIYKEVNKLKK